MPRIRNQTTKNASALTFHDAYTKFINFLSLLIFITATFWRRNFFNKTTLIRKILLILMSCFWCISMKNFHLFGWEESGRTKEVKANKKINKNQSQRGGAFGRIVWSKNKNFSAPTWRCCRGWLMEKYCSR